MRNPKACALLMAALAGCGSTGDAGGGAAHLPVSGAGPFSPLAPDPSLPITAPFVLTDPLADFDDPTVVADGELLAIWVTARRSGGRVEIEHSDAYALTEGFLEPALAFFADQVWEGGEVYGPSVVRDEPWILFYGGGGSIGWALFTTQNYMHVYAKAPGPALRPNVREEGNALGAPAAVRITDGGSDRLRVYYPANGMIWAAEASYADVHAGLETTWTRLDGDPSTPERDPMLRGAPYALSIERVFARAARTPAGRLRHDLYFTARTGPDTTTIGFASSFTGDEFQVAPMPILPAKQLARAPAETPYGDGAVLFYVQRSGGKDAIAAARSP